MTGIEKGGPAPLRLATAAAAGAGAGSAEIQALRGALRLETRMAEALACRSRGLLDLVETLARRALSEAGDIAEARLRLDLLSQRMHEALEAGEAGGSGGISALAARTLAVFDTCEGPRIGWGGPEVRLSSEAARLVALALFELAARSLRHGALALPEGRAGVRWRLRREGGLRVIWREYGAPPGSEALRGGAGGALLPLLCERFGGPLRVRATPFGLRAEFAVPASDLALGPAEIVPLRGELQPPAASASGSGGGRSRT